MNLHLSLGCRTLVGAALIVTNLAPSTQAEDRVLKMRQARARGHAARRLEIVNQS